MKSFFARTVEATGGVLVEKDFGFVKYIPNKKAGEGRPGDVPDRQSARRPRPRASRPPPRRSATSSGSTRPRRRRRRRRRRSACEPSSSTWPSRAEDRGFFARNIVNRLWYRHMGLGLVMPLDQMHRENPPTHPELLDWLATDLAEHGYDLRRLVRGMVLSQTLRPQQPPAGEGRAGREAVRRRPGSAADAGADGGVAEGRVDRSRDLPKDDRIEAVAQRPAASRASSRRSVDNFQVGVAEAMLFANNEKLREGAVRPAPNSLAARLAKEPTSAKRAELAVRSVLARPATAGGDRGDRQLSAIAGRIGRRRRIGRWCGHCWRRRSSGSIIEVKPMAT